MSISVIHTVSSVDPMSGGPSVSVPMLCGNLVKLGCHVTLCTLGQKNNYTPPNDALKIICVRSSLKSSRYEYSIDLRRALSKTAANVDLIHSHGLWKQINRESALVASRNDTIHILSTRGMLEPWALSHHKWRKQIARWIFQDKALNNGNCLHATSLQEYQSIREFGLKNPVAVIPNGVHIDEYACSEDRDYIRKRWPNLDDRRIILFLSRLHPKKGLINLVRAWGSICTTFRNWQLVIAGPDESGHETHVRRAVLDAGASRYTTFIGPVFGEDKKHLYAACDIFVLPSFSENFGIVVAEALASAKPVIVTKGTPWKDLIDHNCGWWIDLGIEPLVATLIEAIELPDHKRAALGLRGRKLIEENYSWPVIANQMIEVYKWCLGKAKKPDYLKLD